MKKTLLSILLLSAATASAQNVNIPDPNFKAYLVGNTAINTNADTEIQVSEAQAFTGTMMCINKDVQDFTGVEEFVNMTGANFSSNDMVYLDLSQNTSLTYFLNSNCFYLSAINLANGNNTNFTQFGTDTSPNLLYIQVDDVNYANANWTYVGTQTTYTLDCSNTEINIPDANLKAFLVGNSNINTNSDTEIQWSEALDYSSVISCDQQNISDMTGIGTFLNIYKLNCSQNDLSGGLDVSNNRQLTELNFDFNSVTSVYLDKNTLLVNLYCQSNSLSSLDVSECSLLERLSCNSNYLTAIDVSSNLLLEKLFCTGNSIGSLDLTLNSLMVELQCSYNNLTDLDLSQNTDWWIVNCSNNQLTSLNIANGNNTNLSALSAKNNAGLNCIEVDDATYSTTNWTNIDSQTSYSENCAAAGIFNQEYNHEVSIYPNPATSILNIKTEAQVLEVKISNLTGQVLLTSTESQINIENLQSGVYLITTLTNQGATTNTVVKK